MQHRKPSVSQFVLGIALLGSAIAAAGTFPDFGYAPPRDWTAATFRLSQQYPQTVPATAPLPWQKIDFRKQPENYLQSVVDYCFEGNLQPGFAVQENAVRPWYHAPWLHYGPNSREFVKGLTRERDSRPFELSPTQTEQFRNFAVAFYNDLGGYTIGQVWKDPQHPDLANVSFPEGTVSCKLLFTTAPASVVEFLKGAPEWIADVDRAQTAQQVVATKVRLLQVDVAVKDNRSAKGGWVFGSFHYDAGVANSNPWLRLRPLTLTWGDDPALLPGRPLSGKQPLESWINRSSPLVKYRTNPPAGVTPPRTLGWAGRGNGAVDNPASSCLSCHSTAQIPAASPMIAPATLAESEKLRWFRNTKANEAFDSGSNSLDFSLQLGTGIENLYSFQAFVANLGGVSAAQSGAAPDAAPGADRKPEYRFSRDTD